MKVHIFTAVLCPIGEYPNKENCKSVNVIAVDIVDAHKTVFESNDSMRVVSLSYASDAILSGTVVDFE